MYINDDVLAGKWKQVRGRIRRSRGQLIHNQLDQILGGLQHHVGLMQERRGVIVGRVERAMKRLHKLPAPR
jgi:uncharacterized protein YjbJ (UPF0337 family)